MLLECNEHEVRTCYSDSKVNWSFRGIESLFANGYVFKEVTVTVVAPPVLYNVVKRFADVK